MKSYLIGACVLLSIVFLRAIFSSPPRPRANEDFYGDDGEHFLQGIVRGTTEPHKLVQPGATPGPATISEEQDSLDSIEGGCGVVSQEASGSLGQVPPLILGHDHLASNRRL